MKNCNLHPPPPALSGFDIPIFQKLYDFHKELYLSINNFPKRDKYTLGQRLELTSLELIELLLSAGKVQSDKLESLEKADAKLDILKVLLRLAKDTGPLDNKKYLFLESHLQEVGKMLGGWIKHAKQSV